MKYSLLGSSGLTVSRVAIGGQHFGSELDQPAVNALVDAGLDLGVNTFYSSDFYGGGRAEEQLGSAVHGRRDDVVLMTKVGYRVTADLSANEFRAMASPSGPDHERLLQRGVYPNSSGLSRRHILSAVEGSLRRLRTDYIDVYQIHYWDPRVRLEETLGTLTDLVRQGKVRYIGCSQAAAWQLYRALWVSEVRGFERFQSVQVRYNILDQNVQPGLLDAAEAAEVGVLAFGALAADVLTGKVSSEADATHVGSRRQYSDMYVTESNLSRAERFVAIAAEAAVDPATLAAAWVLSHRGVTSLLIGPNTPAELKPVANAADLVISEETLQEIAALA